MSLLEKLNNEAQWVEQYYTENTNNPIAEYVDSLGYGGELLHQVEGHLKNRSHLNEDQIDFLKEILKKPKKQAAEEIRDLCELVFYRTIYTLSHEICSVGLGEIEHQISDELSEEIDALSDDEKAELFSDFSEGFMNNSSFMYLDHNYSRWALVLDVYLLDEKIEQKNKLRAIK